MSAYFCTPSVVWAGHDVYPTTESLDDLDASRTGVHHHVMYTTPSLPTMLLHMIWFPRYRLNFWEFTISFYISKCISLHERSLEYIPPESLASCSHNIWGLLGGFRKWRTSHFKQGNHWFWGPYFRNNNLADDFPLPPSRKSLSFTRQAPRRTAHGTLAVGHAGKLKNNL